jgi:hypothetical protein
VVEADKVARDFSASVASAYSLSTNKITLLELNNDLSGLDRSLNTSIGYENCGKKPEIQHVKRQSIGSRKLSGE